MDGDTVRHLESEFSGVDRKVTVVRRMANTHNTPLAHSLTCAVQCSVVQKTETEQ